MSTRFDICLRDCPSKGAVDSALALFESHCNDKGSVQSLCLYGGNNDEVNQYILTRLATWQEQPKLSSLTNTITISGNFKIGLQDATILFDAIKQQKQHQQQQDPKLLCISFQNGTTVSINAISYFMENDTDTSQVSFNNCGLETGENDNNPQGCRLLGNLTLLDNRCLGLSLCRIDSFHDARIYAKIIQDAINFRQISELRFNKMNISIQVFSQLLQPAFPMSDNDNRNQTLANQSITKILLYFCNFNDASSSSTMPTIVAYPQVTSMVWKVNDNELMLPRYSLHEDNRNSITTIMKLLTSCPPFTRINCLDLRCNEVGNDGMRAIAQEINSTNLQRLNLSVTYIFDDDLACLIQSLQSNVTLVHLDISRNNNLTYQSMERLLDLLQDKNNMTLKDLDMDYCDAWIGSIMLDPIPAYTQAIPFYLALNQLGRNQLLQKELVNIPLNLIPLILLRAKGQPSVLYWVIQKFLQPVFVGVLNGPQT